MTIGKRQFMKLGKLILLTAFLSGSLLTASPTMAGNAAVDGPKIGALVERLADSDEGIRKRNMRQLMAYGQSAMPFLVGIREYGSPAQRRGAILGLALLPMPLLAEDTLFNALGDEDVKTRGLAAHTLAMIGTPVAPRLVDSLACEDQLVRDAAAYSLSLMGRKAVPALAASLNTGDVYARSKAAWLLGRMGPDAMAAVPALVRALESEDIRAMHVTAEAIDLINPDPAMVYQQLFLLGSEAYCPVRRLGGKAAPTLVRLLTRPGTPLAQVAFRALATIGPEAVPSLKKALAFGTPSQQTAAALILVDIDPNMVHELPEDVRQSLSGNARQPKQ